jgi:hypothetical protein
MPRKPFEYEWVINVYPEQDRHRSRVGNCRRTGQMQMKATIKAPEEKGNLR